MYGYGIMAQKSSQILLLHLEKFNETSSFNSFNLMNHHLMKHVAILIRDKSHYQANEEFTAVAIQMTCT